MGKMIAKQVLEQIRSANDIADLVGSYVQLKKSGTGFVGLCPFHKEKTPSFHVNPQRQIFHCFGCGKGGDVFRFIMEREGVDFTTAIRMLANKSGIRVELEDDDGKAGESKDLLYRLHDEAAKFFQRILLDHPSAADARAYLKKRDLGPDVVEAFQIGFAPGRSDTMLKFGESKGFTPDQLEVAGLLARSTEEGRTNERYDRFRNRLMFPVRDELGRVIAFSGRVLENDDRGAKYLNSPETPIFRKSKVLYALDKARKAILDARTATVCEGQIDVIRCHMAGITTAVAGLGTALTDEHARVLRRYADAIVLVMDADTAGQNSAMRSAEIFLQAGLAVRVASLPEGEDPDSLLRKQGAAPLLDRIARATSSIEFQCDTLMKRDNMADDAGRMRVIRTVLETISRAPSAVQRDSMLAAAANKLRVSETSLREDLGRLHRPQRPKDPDDERPAHAARPAVRPPEEVELLRAVIHHPETLPIAQQYISPDHFTDPVCRAVGEILLREGVDDLLAALTAEGDEPQRLASELMAGSTRITTTSDEVTPQRAVQDIVLCLRRRDLERRRKSLEASRDTASAGDADRIAAELRQVILDIHTLRQGWEKARIILEL